MYDLVVSYDMTKIGTTTMSLMMFPLIPNNDVSPKNVSTKQRFT
jgi:hypothetical protein